MFRITIDGSTLLRRLGQLAGAAPEATVRALNRSAFEVRAGWVDEVKKVFDRPTPYTQRAPLYKKATVERMVAEVFIRDEAAKGTPPVKYLLPQVRGGPRAQKASERLLQRYLGFPPYWVPGPGAPRDAYGNVPGGFIQRVLSSVQATADPAQRTPGRKVSRRSRGRKRMFFLPPPGVGSRLKRTTIYERTADGKVMPVLIGVTRPPAYRPRFDAMGVARRIFYSRFKINAAIELNAMKGMR
jgi:hypothetical protein